nr:MADS [Ipomoea batatas]GME00149.1 MADS [Ipomoea batatas]
MQDQLKKLRDVNRALRREIRQRMGEGLNDLSFEQLTELIEDVDNSIKLIRERKVRNVEEIHRNLLLECVSHCLISTALNFSVIRTLKFKQTCS